jgi:LysM repeat protein
VEALALASSAMSKWPVSWRIILIIVFCCFVSGCMPVAETPVDEEKDPNFIDGRNHLNMMDYKSAIESFERAVQANPRNAAAHFELGVLYDDRMKEPLKAAFHYQKHLELRPKSSYLDAAKSRLEGCKMEIAKSVRIVVVHEQVHKDLAKLTNELANSQRLNEQLRAQLAAKPMVVTQWMQFRVTNPPVYLYVTNTSQQQQQVVRPVATNTAPAPRSVATNTATRVTPLPPANVVRRMEQRAAQQARAATRTHSVRAGDTMSSVARRYGVSLPRLQAANPGVDPRKLRAGQTLNIPSQ